jgi:hypothetical protein
MKMNIYKVTWIIDKKINGNPQFVLADNQRDALKKASKYAWAGEMMISAPCVVDSHHLESIFNEFDKKNEYHRKTDAQYAKELAEK